MPLVPRHLNPKMRFACNAEAVATDARRLSNLPRGATRTALAPMLALILLLTILTPLAAGAVQVRDLVMVAGARDNQLVGYGLVAGLAGDGDKDPIYTQETVANM